MHTQLALPVPINQEEIARKKTLGDAIELCAELAGYSRDKETSTDVGVDKAQLSRWKSGGEGIMWPKFEKLMDSCGNDAPLLWMLYQRVYDPFCGLGTVPYRAILKGRTGGGSELNQAYFLDQVHYLKAAEREVSMPSLFDFDKEAA